MLTWASPYLSAHFNFCSSSFESLARNLRQRPGGPRWRRSSTSSKHPPGLPAIPGTLHSPSSPSSPSSSTSARCTGKPVVPTTAAGRAKAWPVGRWASSMPPRSSTRPLANEKDVSFELSYAQPGAVPVVLARAGQAPARGSREGPHLPRRPGMVGRRGSQPPGQRPFPRRPGRDRAVGRPGAHGLVGGPVEPAHSLAPLGPGAGRGAHGRAAPPGPARLAHRPAQPPPGRPESERAPRPGPQRRLAHRGVLHRPRRLQEGERHLGPLRRRRAAAGRGRPALGGGAGLRHRRDGSGATSSWSCPRLLLGRRARRRGRAAPRGPARALQPGRQPAKCHSVDVGQHRHRRRAARQPRGAAA